MSAGDGPASHVRDRKLQGLVSEKGQEPLYGPGKFKALCPPPHLFLKRDLCDDILEELREYLHGLPPFFQLFDGNELDPVLDALFQFLNRDPLGSREARSCLRGIARSFVGPVQRRAEFYSGDLFLLFGDIQYHSGDTARRCLDVDIAEGQPGRCEAVLEKLEEPLLLRFGEPGRYLLSADLKQ